MVSLFVGFSGSVFADTPADGWQKPGQDILDVLHAKAIPSHSVSPDGQWLLSSDPVYYPPLSDLAAPMHPLAGERVDPITGGFHGEGGAQNPALRRMTDTADKPLPLAQGVRILEVTWSADSARFALTTKESDRIGLWVGDTSGKLAKVDLALVPLLGAELQWLPDQQRLLVKARPPTRQGAPAAPLTPPGPTIRTSDGSSASSTYEARDLLASAHDDALFDHYMASQLMVVDAASGKVSPVGIPDVYAGVTPSPDGKYLLVERLKRPWSHRVAWWKFAHNLEVWTAGGVPVHTVTSQPAAEQVPIHGVPTGPRDVQWRSNADATLVWVEALDGGDPSAKVPHRDRLFQLVVKNPVKAKPTVLMDAAHRVSFVAYGDKGLTIVQQYERERRWRHVWTVDANKGAKSAKAWFDLSANERYDNPGNPVYTSLPNGHSVIEQQGDWVYFRGDGSSPTGDRPFLDRRSLKTGATERLFRSDGERYERFIRFADPLRTTFLLLGESPEEPPNLHLVTLGAAVKAEKGEALFARTSKPVTNTPDPAPVLRGVSKQIVTYNRKDGTPQSFTLYLPPGYKAGERLPTVVYAYPREFSDAGTAGQVAGSERTFNRLYGPSHLFFALDGYAVLHNTTMPVIGDPDTAYDQFVEQLVMSAEAAVDKAVEMGVTDRERVGVTGHSHGGLMTVTLLAHSDLFKAGIARSGAYNHTIRPFGFQSERRTLWDAKDTYLHLSPVMHAPKINEPLLLIHGAIDENPGTVPLQSERLFEAVRGVGGTTRLLMLPHEGHGYRAVESVEHVLWEQLTWFDRYVKQAGASTVGAAPGSPENVGMP